MNDIKPLSYKQKGSDFYLIRYAGPDGRIIRESSETSNFKDAQVRLENQRKAIRNGKEPEPTQKPYHDFKVCTFSTEPFTERRQYAEYYRARKTNCIFTA